MCKDRVGEMTEMCGCWKLRKSWVWDFSKVMWVYTVAFSVNKRGFCGNRTKNNCCLEEDLVHCITYNYLEEPRPASFCP